MKRLFISTVLTLCFGISLAQGVFTTRDAQLIDASGQPFVIAGINNPQDIIDKLTAAKEKSLPMIVGEFGYNFNDGQYNPNNLFSALLGKSEAEVQARIDSVWTHFFTPGDISKYDADGEKCVYYEVGDSMGIIVDTGSNDVRTEGMSYGMMISVQLDKREVFDRGNGATM